jgi:glycosyltransferase involved in cell wall biosynthesis
MKTAPIVSIVIPAYNCASTIRQTIESCLAQTLGDIEIIVVDDGSTDGTAAILAEFGEPVCVIRQSNRGLAAARNAGLVRARGDFIAWLDADDLADPRRMEIQSRVLSIFPELVLLHTEFTAFGALITDTVTPYSPVYYPVLRAAMPSHPFYQQVAVPASGPEAGLPTVYVGNVTEGLISGNFVHPPTIMMRRSAFEAIGPLDESMQSGCDYDFILRASRRGAFGYIDLPLLRYRISPAQMSGRFPAGETMLENARILDKLRTVDPQYYASNQRAIQRRISMSLLDAAQQVGETRRSAGLALWFRSISHADKGAAIRVLLRLLMPGIVMNILRKTRGVIAGRRQAS